MITIRKSSERGHADHGWLNSHHTFSFANYHDPAHMGFRSLRVINDDIVAGGGGFPTHPHRDMEIISYVLKGALQHKDSMGNGSVIKPGQFQYMAAGTGVRHSEFNPSPTEAMRLLQIWIMPDAANCKPQYAEKSMTDAASGKLHLITSKTGRDNSIAINQDADLYLAKLEAGESVTHEINEGRNVWIQIAEGTVRLNGRELATGDAAAVTKETSISLEGVSPAQVLLFDLN